MDDKVDDPIVDLNTASGFRILTETPAPPLASEEVRHNSAAASAVDASTTATASAIIAATATSNATAAASQVRSSEPPASVSLAFKMQCQIATLQQQLKESQVRLGEKNRQCYKLETALRNTVQPASAAEIAANTSAAPVVMSVLAPPAGAIAHNLTNLPNDLHAQNVTAIATTNFNMPFAENRYTSAATNRQAPTSTFASSAAMPSTQQASAADFLFSSLPSSTLTANQMHAEPISFRMPNIYSPPLPRSVLDNSVHMPSNDLHNLSFLQNSAMTPRKVQELPNFSGEPEDWPIFYTAYVQSTTVYNYTNFENNQRLQKCIKGEAREVIKSLLIHPDNVNAAIEQLRFRFGRPEQLIYSQLRQVRELPNISENALSKLVPFATKVKNLAIFLQSVNGQQHIANPTLLEELVSKLPMSKKLDWARVAVSIHPYPTICHFSMWVSELSNLVCTIQDADSKDQKHRVVLYANEKQGAYSTGTTHTTGPAKCPICQGQHKLQDCRRFISAAVPDRWVLVKKHRACFSCLNLGHITRNCHRKKPCAEDGCQRRHHSLLHEAFAAPTTSATPQEERSNAQGSVLSCAAIGRDTSKLLFRVLPVTLYGEKKRIDTYALLDEGSSITMVDSELAEELGVRGRQHRLNIQWLGGRSAQEPSVVFNIEVSGAAKNKRHLLRNVYAVSNLNLPMQSLHRGDLVSNNSFVRSLPLKPYSSVVPKLLIGIDHAHLGLPTDIQKMSDRGPFACNTELGWVVFGPTCKASPTLRSCLLVRIQENDELHQLVADYFNVENIGVRSSPPVECNDDVIAKRILQETTKRTEGRFQTGLLWKEKNVQLPDNYAAALRRLEGIEQKMSRDDTFAASYKQVIEGYVNKGYARKLTEEEAVMTSPKKWYLPHFGVVNPNKPKKLRLVFDAAAQVAGVSLNSELLKGPQQYISLPSILFNFRCGAIAVTGDIREMFHQIIMQPADRFAQRFLWRDGVKSKRVEEYEMRVMTFGAACSPCSAQYVMKLNAREHHKCHPRAIEAIIDHHYIDDFVDSFDTVKQAIEISKQVREIHSNGGFDLRGFASNSNEVLKALDGSATTKIIAAGENTEKVLGLYWDSASDNFMFQLKFHRVDQAVISGERSPTKRELLSIIMSTFDPLGFLSHFTVAAKSLMREVWRRDVRWDESLPTEVNLLWEQWRHQMCKVAEFRVPRFYFSSGSPINLELHVFVDASEEAFAAAAYWRSTKPDGGVNVALICAKTKCAPLKPVSIPRLELQAAVLGVRVLKCILDDHKMSPQRFILWSDSKTVLKWIGSEHRRYKPYVAHRVAEVLAGSEVSSWRWVPTKDNVADDATRAHGSIDFSPSSRWLLGPEFLRHEESTWPISAFVTDHLDEAEEELRPKFALIVNKFIFIDYDRFSSLIRLKRTVAWALRFINHCRKRKSQCEEYGLTVAELETAERLIILRVQDEAFTNELNCIRADQDISKDSTLRYLLPYLDNDGLINARGRIDAASFLPYNARRPIILPYDHAYSRLVVRYYHWRMMHQNHEATLCEIRRVYWIPRIRRLLRSIIASCYVCRINKAQPLTPIMGSLPKDRLEPYVRPFSYTGLDYFGPISVTIGRRTEKRWVALFTCLTMRAIHLEVAHDLSTDSCIIAMRNFMNRRGVPVRLRSDNGKNFIGANEEAKRFTEVFDADRVQSELSIKGVEWWFNCPANPSEGGVWERMVQCVKKVLRHSLKDVAPREHVLESLLIEAENIVNSRPLTHLPISPDEEEPLTPNHFLIGATNAAQTPAASTPDDKINGLRKQWRVARNLRDRFWKRWVIEYLPTLTRRVKWCQRTAPLKAGDAVFICDPNMPRKQWRRGVVECVYTGVDGVARRADVRTVGGVLQRAVSKLAVLDLDDGEADRSTGAGVLTNEAQNN